MKLCYAFLNNHISYEMFSILMPDFIKALNYKAQEVNEIAAYCLIMIIKKTGTFKLTTNSNNKQEEEEDENEE